MNNEGIFIENNDATQCMPGFHIIAQPFDLPWMISIRPCSQLAVMDSHQQALLSHSIIRCI